MKSVVIFLPGVLGSELTLDGEVIWPGKPLNYVLPYPKMTQLLSDDLEPTDCMRTYYDFYPVYQPLIDNLSKCGFSETKRTLIIFPYDWRRDIAKIAQKLAKCIEEAIAFHGTNTSITLIGHSMGGLVSRYYLEAKEFNNHQSHKNISQLITFGTPHSGGALALSAALGHEKRLFLSKDQVHLLASDVRYPSLYQILPPQSEPFVWNRKDKKRFNNVDIYDPVIARKLGLVQANLSAAQRFHKSLDYNKRPVHVRYFCFSGTRQRTVTHYMIRLLESGKSIPEKIEEEGGGDGTVPTWSAFLAGSQRMFVGGDHLKITRNFDASRALAALLGSEGRLKGVPEQVDVSLRNKVLEPEDSVYATISFPKSIRDFSGVMTMERAKINAVTQLLDGYGKSIKINSVSYKGLDLQTMSIQFTAPSIPGVYRVAFRNNMNTKPAGFDQLIIQETA